ncbi:hypothetical protein HPB50_008347 [Hyalomma asiaticum]|uniref:Uncharacterized protein n=1 Tax=Hyalomma asiaticum TaxID=266040 RepID=A0ACB7T061_HYAAI|nr:hypothetical protein HPB50_008347 [Hyalomma asiaticum]
MPQVLVEVRSPNNGPLPLLLDRHSSTTVHQPVLPRPTVQLMPLLTPSHRKETLQTAFRLDTPFGLPAASITTWETVKNRERWHGQTSGLGGIVRCTMLNFVLFFVQRVVTVAGGDAGAGDFSDMVDEHVSQVAALKEALY